jgi:hypothetical protein
MFAIATKKKVYITPEHYELYEKEFQAGTYVLYHKTGKYRTFVGIVGIPHTACPTKTVLVSPLRETYFVTLNHKYQ